MLPDTWWNYMTETQVLGITLSSAVGKFVLVLVSCLVALVAQRVLVGIARRVLDKSSVPSVSILLNILRGIIWSLALMGVLEPVFGVQPTAFVAALGVGSVALSLGLQDTVSNVIGGLSLMISKVIEPGDVIKVGDFTGLVTDINWRSTCLRDAYGQINVIPNSVLSKTALVKLSERVRGRCQITLVIKHGTDLNEVFADVARVARDVLGAKVDPELGVEVLMNGFDAFGIQGTANVHLVHGVDFDEARTVLTQHLAGRPWVASVS
ncbi:MAG: mechanosensitive ion channel [Acidobacteriota bacterium]|nr:mechanosensitive ion channel [Acidobacteriota bacterium]